jgi:CheY-like chemotaxis protein
MHQRSQACVLIVDDERDFCLTLKMVLRLEGYDVVTSPDGVDALACLRGGLHPCLILLDMMMPRMNGPQFREEQVRDPALREIPVIVLTGGGDPVLRQAAALGLMAIRKPVDLAALLSEVERFCGSREKARPP